MCKSDSSVAWPIPAQCLTDTQSDATHSTRESLSVPLVFFSIIHLVCIVASIYILQRYVSRAFDLRNIRDTHEKKALLRGCAEEGVIVPCRTAEGAVPTLQNDAIPLR